jgi:hypothetical protein
MKIVLALVEQIGGTLQTSLGAGGRGARNAVVFAPQTQA